MAEPPLEKIVYWKGFSLGSNDVLVYDIIWFGPRLKPFLFRRAKMTTVYSLNKEFEVEEGGT